MEENQHSRIHVIIQGRVQGVGFRFFVQKNAKRLSLTGWTRNKLNQSVEVVAEGSPSNLEEFLKELQQGPVSSEVTNINTDWGNYSGEFKRFRIRMTR